MTPETFKSIRNRAGLTQSRLAAALGISDSRTIRRWEDGSRPVSGPAAVCMELLDAGIWQPSAKGE
jgi:DNA-binding transcriptional regulator YiaG